MRDMSSGERGEVTKSFSSEDPEERGVVKSLARMPISPDDLNTLSREIPDYLAVTGRKIIMMDDVVGGVSSQLVMGLEGVGLSNRRERGLVELDYERLRGILDVWDDSLRKKGIELESTEDVKDFIADVQEVTGGFQED